MINAAISYEEISTVSVTKAGAGQAYFVAAMSERVDVAEAAASAYAEIAEMLSASGMEIVHERIFGSLSVEATVRNVRAESLRTLGVVHDGPATYIEGHPPWGEGFAGVIIRAVAPTGPDDTCWTIKEDGIPCGRGWRRNGATFVVLQNMAGIKEALPALQARHMFERAERILRSQESTYRDVVRTWCYLSDMLDWYGEFNSVRNAKYDSFGIMPGSENHELSLPASTGIQAITSHGGACTMDLLAVGREADTEISVKKLTSPVQQDAFCYGSAFSRGAVIHEPDVSTIQVSGTASIDENGASLYPGDVRAQINCTLDKIEALIGREGARLKDICAATVFVKHPEDAAIYKEVAASRGLEQCPAICVVADVCRDELLFEIDAEVAFKQGEVCLRDVDFA